MEPEQKRKLIYLRKCLKRVDYNNPQTIEKFEQKTNISVEQATMLVDKVAHLLPPEHPALLMRAGIFSTAATALVAGIVWITDTFSPQRNASTAVKAGLNEDPGDFVSGKSILVDAKYFGFEFKDEVHNHAVETPAMDSSVAETVDTPTHLLAEIKHKEKNVYDLAIPTEADKLDTHRHELVLRTPCISIEKALKEVQDVSDVKRAAVANLAVKSCYMIPYFWGGKDSDTDILSGLYSMRKDDEGIIDVYGLDCSGWVQNIFGAASFNNDACGIIGLNTTQQKANSTKISVEEAEIGDLVGGPGHIGIIVGTQHKDLGILLVAHESGSMNGNVIQNFLIDENGKFDGVYHPEYDKIEFRDGYEQNIEKYLSDLNAKFDVSVNNIPELQILSALGKPSGAIVRNKR